MPDAIQASDFSSFLFWDVAVDSVDLEKHRPWLVKRVLEKGTRTDWNLLLQLYQREAIRDAVKQLRSLEKKAASFACAVFDLPQTELRCSKNRQSPHTPWDY
jgi:hypothetical protein